MSALASGDVWAVGIYSYNGSPYQTLVEHWNGTAWSVVPSPNVGSGNNYLSGVSALSNGDVWAVGEHDYNVGSVGQTLVEHWNGTAWSVVPSPNLGSGDELLGVSALSNGDVWAVGTYYDSGSVYQTLVEHWNGTAWSVVPSPNPGTGDNNLSGVSALASSDIWAVGNDYPHNGIHGQTLIEHWDGTAWSVVPSPSPGTGDNFLGGASALARSDVWVVGGYSYNGSPYQTLVEHWNGTAWSIVPSPNASSYDNSLGGVSALTSSDIWAVGSYGLTLVEHWNGAAWSVVPSPNIGSNDNSLSGVLALASSDVWAVGFYWDTNNTRTLVEHWNGSNWSIVFSPSPGQDGTPTPEPSPTPCTRLGDVHPFLPCSSATPTGISPTVTPLATCGPDTTPGPWAVRSPAPVFSYGAATSADDTGAYVAGGIGYSGGSTNDLFARFDPAANVWTTLSPMPDRAGLASGVYAPNVNKMFVFGGEETDSASVYYTTRIYDVSSGAWSLGTRMPGPRMAMGGGYWNGKIYLAGGQSTLSSSNIESQLWEYDPLTNSWNTSLAGIPEPRAYPGSGVINGHLYLAGGRSLASSAVRTLYDYNIATNTWTERAQLLTAVNGPGSATIGGRLWAFGGGDIIGAHRAGQAGGNAPATVLNVLQIYDPPADTWAVGPSLNQARAFPGGTAVGNEVLAIGGFTGSVILSSVETSMTDPQVCASATATLTATGTASNTPAATPTGTTTAAPSSTPTPTACVSASWTAQAPYPITTGGHAVAAAGGIVYSFGGIVNNAAIANSYKYTPATHSWTAIAPLPAPRGWFSAVSDGTAIYLLGGVDQNFNSTATLWRYDPATNTYATNLASYSIPTYNHAAAYLAGKIYRIAGRAIGTDYHVEVYTIATNSWAMEANYPIASHTLMAVALGNYIYAGGGNSAPTKAYRYDPLTDTWDDAAIADLPQGRSAAASDSYNGRWLLAGGDVNFAVSTNVIAWDPVTNAWNTLPGMFAPRDYLGGATAGQGFDAVAGDSGPGTPTNDNQQYRETNCATGTPTTPPSTALPSATATAAPPSATTTQPPATPTQPLNTTPTATQPAVNTPTPTQPPAPSPTPGPSQTPCSISFSDVHPADYFYTPVLYLACHGVISGYSDGTFRPYASTTRSQMVKIVVLGFNKPITTPGGGAYSFTDVPRTNPFFAVVETGYADGIVSGYTCGTAPVGPCDSLRRPYFLPYNNVTRGQLSKIDVLAAGWALYNPPVPHFTDVPAGSTFYTVIETAYCRGVISGYSDLTFRPFNNSTRGQIAKIVYLSIVNPPTNCGATP